MDAITRVSWHVVGTSVQGTSHQKNQTPCQDACAYRQLPGGILLAAVADGAGTADHAREGAELAVRSVLDSAEKMLSHQPPTTPLRWQGLLIKAFRNAHHTLVDRAREASLPSRMFATTLTCVVATGDWLAVGQIGDGVAVAQASAGELFTMLAPQRGEYANETHFLTMENALEHVDTQVYRQPVSALAIMTDGLMRLAMNVTHNSPHPPFFQPLLTFAAQVTDESAAQAQLSAFLASERVCARTDDDKTLVLAVQNHQNAVVAT